MNDEEFETSNRDRLISDYLRERGIFSVEDAPEEFLEAAHAEADKVLGKNKDN